MFGAQKSEKRRRYMYPLCVRGVAAVLRRLEVGADSLEIMDSFYYLGDVISYDLGCHKELSWAQYSSCYSSMTYLT